jgi:hypothetical protein
MTILKLQLDASLFMVQDCSHSTPFPHSNPQLIVIELEDTISCGQIIADFSSIESHKLLVMIPTLEIYRFN